MAATVDDFIFPSLTAAQSDRSGVIIGLLTAFDVDLAALGVIETFAPGRLAREHSGYRRCPEKIRVPYGRAVGAARG